MIADRQETFRRMGQRRREEEELRAAETSEERERLKAEREQAAADAKAKRDAANTKPYVLVKLHGPYSSKSKIRRPPPFRFPDPKAWPWPANLLGWLVLSPAAWIARWSRQGLKFLKVALSADAPADLYLARQAECQKCPRRVRSGEHSYCGQCGCPRWLLSRLEYKNSRMGWHCPERRHPGPYPDDGLRKTLLESGDVSEADLAVDVVPDDKPSGCGCGADQAGARGDKRNVAEIGG